MREALEHLANNNNNNVNNNNNNTDNNDTDEFYSSDDDNCDSLLSSPSSSSRATPSTAHHPPGSLRNPRGGATSKRFRTQMTSTMIKVMKSIFADYKTPTMAECQSLGASIGLPKRVVQVWFQNARAKDKKARLAFTKTFGTDFESSQLNSNHSGAIEECKICGVKYDLKLTTTAMQEHIFSDRHIAKLKVSIEQSSARKADDGEEEDSADFPVASGHPIPATMLVNPHSTTFNPSAFPLLPAGTPADNPAGSSFLQLFQGFKQQN